MIYLSMKYNKQTCLGGWGVGTETAGVRTPENAIVFILLWK